MWPGEQGQLSIDAAYTLTQLDDDSIQTIVQQDKKSIKAKVKEIKQEKQQNKPNKDESEQDGTSDDDDEILTHIPYNQIQSITLHYQDEHTHNDVEYTLTILNREQKQSLHDLLISFIKMS